MVYEREGRMKTCTPVLGMTKVEGRLLDSSETRILGCILEPLQHPQNAIWNHSLCLERQSCSSGVVPYVSRHNWSLLWISKWGA